VIAVSEAIRGELICGVGMAPAEVITLRPGIQLDAFCPVHKRSSPRASFNIGIVGRLEPEKGHELVLRAMPEILRRSSAPVSLHIIGEGSRRPALMEAIEAHGLSSNVVFAGYVHDVRARLAQLDLVVSASTREGLGIALIEAMAMGLPVVASRIGGIPEVVEDGVTGILFRSGDAKALAEAVLDILGDKERARHMGAAARRSVEERFNLDRTLEVLEAIYAGEKVD
jgi:glycosyltransferase involved in cell wall biosynthesis